MILELTGVLADASHPAPTVQPKEPTRQDIRLPRGEPLTIKLTVLKQDHSPYDLSTATVRLGVRQFLDDPAAAITKQATITDFPGGLADIVVAAVDTQSLLQNCDYFFDVQLTDGSLRYQIVPVSTFRILATVNQPADVPSLGSVEQYLSFPPDTVANWKLSQVRYFLVDGVNGNDADNRGWIDAAAGSTLSPAGLAKKTIAGFLAILPRTGAGRSFKLLIANASAAGTAYAETLDLSQCSGFGRIIVQGSTDLTNSVVDRIKQGAMQAQVGPNGDGSWTVSSVTGVAAINVAAGLTTTGAGLEGRRVRFSTGALSATPACRGIWRNSATAIEWGSDATAPAVNDQVFIEKAGVRLNRFIAPANVAPTVNAAGTYIQMMSVSGIAVTSATAGAFVIGHCEQENYSFCEVEADTTARVLQTTAGTRGLELSISFRDEVDVLRTVGVGIRCAGGYFFCPTNLSITFGSFHGVMTAVLADPSSINMISASVLTVTGGTVFRRGVELSCIPVSGRVAGIQVGGLFGGGAPGLSGRSARIVNGPLIYRGGGLSICGVEWEGCTVACLTFNSPQSTVVRRGGPPTFLDNLTNGPAGGNTDVGIDVSQGYGVVAIAGTLSACTVSGAVGEIRLRGSAAAGVLTTYDGLTKTNVVDLSKNDVIGTAGARVTQCVLTTNKKGGAMAVGDVVKSNGTTKQVNYAQADVETNARAIACMVTPPADNAEGYYVDTGTAYMLTTGAMTAGDLVHLSAAVAGRGTNTAPTSGVDRKQRLGRIHETATGAAYVTLKIDSESVLAP